MRNFNVNQTMPKCHFSSIKLTKVQKLDNTCWRGLEQTGTLIHRWWECQLVTGLTEGNLVISSRMTYAIPSNRGFFTSRIHPKDTVPQI